MRVLLINGSPHQKGCTYTALSEVVSVLNEEGIDTDFYWIGNMPIGGCIGCFRCAKKQKYGVVAETERGGGEDRCFAS